MLVGIHKSKLGKFPEDFQVYEKILDHNGIEHIRLDINESDFWHKVKKLDLFIYVFHNTTDMKELARTIIPIIQNQLHIKCFPDVTTGWPYDDKIKEYYLLKLNDFPVIESYIFWNIDFALDWAENINFPLVFKLKAGSQSNNVLLVNKKPIARKLIKKMFGKGINPNKIPNNIFRRFKDFTIQKFIHNIAIRTYRLYKGLDLYPYWDKQKNYIIFQEFLPDNTFDTRITIIGNRAFGFIRYNRKNDFRASGSGLKDYEKSKIDTRCVEIAFKVSEKMKFQSMAYDFLYDENNDPVICEISYTYPFKSIFEAPGYWDQNLKWHSGNYWPQYFHVMDALQIPDLLQPDISPWEENSSIEQVQKKLFKK